MKLQCPTCQWIFTEQAVGNLQRDLMIEWAEEKIRLYKAILEELRKATHGTRPDSGDSA